MPRMRAAVCALVLVFLALAAWGGPAAVKAQGLPAPQGDALGSIESATPTIEIQQQERRKPKLFRFLFKKGERRAPVVLTPPPQQKKVLKRKTVRQKARRQTTKRRAKRAVKQAAPAAAVAAAPEPAKAENAREVLVIGDFMGRALARGLAEAFSEDPSVKIVNAAEGSSGLVRDDYFDWSAELTKRLEAEDPPDAVVVMIGANDRQAFLTERIRLDTGEGSWSDLYNRRIREIADILAEKNVPGLWVGLTPVSAGGLARDYSIFNSRYREQLETSPVEFVDIWDAFADDQGRYVVNGPDVSGQTRQLRTSDGLNFTRAGRRKLAFFVERDLKRVLDEGAPAALAGIIGGSLTGAEMQGPPMPQAPVIGPMIPLNAVQTGEGDALATLEAEPRSAAPAYKGAPPDGRVDAFGPASAVN